MSDKPATQVSREHLEYLKRRKQYRIKVLTVQALLLIAMVAIWEVAANMRLVDPSITSQPSRVIRTLVNLHQDGVLYYHIGVTVFETVARRGWAI